jgi:biopolymer transport protein ExbD
MRKYRNTAEAESDVDMTPMLDIVFIMLIFFIVTTSFVKEDGIIIHRPSKIDEPNPDPTPKRPIVIDISEANEITMSGRVLDANAIRANIETARSQNPKAMVIVRAHESATAGIVISAVDQSRLAGIDKVTVIKPAS